MKKLFLIKKSLNEDSNNKYVAYLWSFMLEVSCRRLTHSRTVC